MSYANISLPDLPPADFIAAVNNNMEVDYSKYMASPMPSEAPVGANEDDHAPVGVGMNISDQDPVNYHSTPVSCAYNNHANNNSVTMGYRTWEGNSTRLPFVMAFDLPDHGCADRSIVHQITAADFVQAARASGLDIDSKALSRAHVLKIEITGHTFDVNHPYAVTFNDNSAAPKQMYKGCVMKTCGAKSCEEIGWPLVQGDQHHTVYMADSHLTDVDRNLVNLTMHDVADGIMEFKYSEDQPSTFAYPKNKLPLLKWLFELRNQIVDRFEDNPSFVDHHNEGYFRIPQSMHQTYLESYKARIEACPTNDISVFTTTLHPLAPGGMSGNGRNRRMFMFLNITAQIPDLNTSKFAQLSLASNTESAANNDYEY